MNRRTFASHTSSSTSRPPNSSEPTTFAAAATASRCDRAIARQIRNAPQAATGNSTPAAGSAVSSERRTSTSRQAAIVMTAITSGAGPGQRRVNAQAHPPHPATSTAGKQNARIAASAGPSPATSAAPHPTTVAPRQSRAERVHPGRWPSVSRMSLAAKRRPR
ncbi:MAG: hypothetical protein ABSA93_02145 [Streptosporangiaceae bacterium]